ncbi:zinc finger and BTB domain-containing protein 12-like [Melanotaenia boesemani]|uniref:zinc finger and BTB domain-containing protein 12-like n=1 Tax=Melanotaenia boesemani TaxID=1250792 RepID=UPI001C05BEE8|nr:zinc finger and BTB domain-containing protein 12-like [Melanotaenia boesemani]
MSSSSDSLQFTLSTHGDSILCKMNVLREEHRFCDIQLILGSTNDSTTQLLRFHGHRVVLAASSDFLRDQFLLHEDQAELSVRVVSSARVAKTLLLSCYTGVLEVPLRELVSYLTAASALQMSQVVEKCTQALSQYLNPDPCLKLQRCSKEKEKQQLDRNWRSSSSGNQRGMDAVQLSTSILESNTKKERAVLSQPKLNVSQEAEVDGQGLREIKLMEISQKQHEQRGGQAEEENVLTVAAQLQDGELMESKLCGQSGTHLVKINLTAEDSDSIVVQRPYLCRRCDKIFQHLQSYVGHLKEHRQFPCLVCGESFSQKSKLTRHIHVHTGVKPFRCPLCHKTFTQKALLQEHLHLHTGNWSHMCALQLTHKPGLRRQLSESRTLPKVLEEGSEAELA